MFWRFGGYAGVSTIDTLLDKPDVSLEDLLDESEVIQELKQHNTKLIEYLREDNVLKRLMDYVVAPTLLDDDDDSDESNDSTARRNEDPASTEKDDGGPLAAALRHEELETAEGNRLKHAYVACEILSSEIWSIMESVIFNRDHLRQFWDFLRGPPPLDSMQASYFTKVNETLFDKKTEEMLGFFKSLDGIVPAILQHVDNPMVMDLLLKIISLERAEGGQGIVDWLKAQGLIPTLLSFLSPEHPASVQTSAGDFLKAIITISANATQNDQSCIGPNSLTRELVSAQCVESLIAAMLKGGNPLTVGVGIVIEVIRKNNSDYDPEAVGGPDSMPTTYDPIYLGILLRHFAKHIPDFMALIRSSKHTVNDDGKAKSVERGELSSAWGAKIEPLGFDRFKTCELMAELLHCSNMGLLNEPGSDEYIRHRDAERERLIREGAFNTQHEGGTAIDYNDSTADLTIGSIRGAGSPEDIKALEVTNASEEEGFEDVNASAVLVDKEEDVAVSSQDSKAEGTPTQEPREDSGRHSEHQGGTSEKRIPEEAPKPSSDPQSPTASGLTTEVSDIKLDKDRNPVNLPESDKPEEQPTETATSSQSDREQEKPHETSAPMSSYPEDVPAPLFAAKPQTETPSPDPVAEAGASSHETPAGESAPEQPSGSQADQANPWIQIDPNGKPVVGDYLKIMFVQNQVVPTILGFFFRFPWNNFLHNVVYDVVQQVFNGPMERGYNRLLAVDLFETGRITEQIVEGQKRSDEAQRAKQIRLGYMGHLTLIAEEVVKFSERHSPELLSQTVMESVLNQEWIDYVEQTLSETRERDNAILGGVRPDMSIGHRQTLLNAVGPGQTMNTSTALAEAGLNGGIGSTDLQGFDMMNSGSASGGAFTLGGGGGALLSGFASSSDDEDEEMEDQDDRHAEESTAQGGPENDSTNSDNQPIPILPPPPAPLSLGPSRARRQLAARLAMQKQNAADNNEAEGEDRQQGSDSQNSDNPFIIAGLEDTQRGGEQNPDADFPSPTFPESGFSPPDSLSSHSSDGDGDRQESVRRNERVPLEVVEGDDDDMGEMVGPSVGGSGMMDSDDEDEAIINESLGYPNLGADKYKNLEKPRVGGSPYGDDEQNDSSDGEEGLVEILVPGRKSPSHSRSKSDQFMVS